MNKRFLIRAIGLLAASAAGFTTPAHAAPHGALRSEGKVVEVTDRDNNETVNLSVGDKLVVRLVSNPSTGYSWKVGEINQQLLRLLGSPRFEAGKSGLLGAPGVEVFEFEARAPGGSGLGLLYQNPSNRGVQAAHTFRLRVVTRGSGENPEPVTIVVTDADNGEALKLDEGDTLLVRLQSNPTTGYSWDILDNTDLILESQGDKYVPPKTRRAGASGYQEFEFKAVGMGEVSLKMVYQRPFDKPPKPVKAWQMYIYTQEPAAPGAGAKIKLDPPITFTCEGGASFTVEFGPALADISPPVAQVLYDGQVQLLKQEEAADGFSYANDVWSLRGKGDSATLTDAATNTPIAENCISAPPAAEATPPSAPASASAPVAASQTVTYTCRDNSMFSVVFGDRSATVTYDGQTQELPLDEAADGFSYMNDAWALRGKGAMASLFDVTTNTVIGLDCLDLTKTDAGQHAPVTFTCADGASFVVDFDPNFAVVTYKGDARKLEQTEAADGFSYTDKTWELRGKGDTATLTDLSSNTVVGQDCTSK